MNNRNPILIADSYKYSHFLQYPPGTEYVYAYIEPRKACEYTDEVVVFGINAFIDEVLSVPITPWDIEDAERDCADHGIPFNRAGFERILEVHAGRFPVEIKALPEGTVINVKNVIATIVNTDPELPWVTSFIETALLSYLWYGTTVASISRAALKTIHGYLVKNGTPESLPYRLHDFGMRGTGPGAHALGGAAHLINSCGTDTVSALQLIRNVYGAPFNSAVSIPASEHSTVTSWGEDGEFDFYKNMVDQFAKPGAVFACVIDSYDTFGALEMWAELLPIVKERGATVVLRPDSGDPVETPVNVILALLDIAGFELNSKGYKVLPDHVRVIQGDGVNPRTIGLILDRLDRMAISADNISFGMGGALLQRLDRDTFGFAMKTSAIKGRGHGNWTRVCKNPVTMPEKASRAGLLAVNQYPDGGLFTEVVESLDAPSLLVPPDMDVKFEEIRERAKIS